MSNFITDHNKFLTLISNYVLHLKYYYEQGLVTDSLKDFKKFTDHFLLEKSIDIEKIVTKENLELLEELDISSLDLDLEPPFRKFLEISFEYFIKTLTANLNGNIEKILFRLPEPVEMSWETFSAGLNYERNNDSTFSEIPSAFTFAKY